MRSTAVLMLALAQTLAFGGGCDSRLGVGSSDPNDPNNPNDPSDLSDPNDPDNPDDPNNPDDPDDPADPSDPDVPPFGPCSAQTCMPTARPLLTVGASHACAVHMGQLYCWGKNSAGQLAQGDLAERATAVTPTQISAAQIGQIELLSAGSQHTCALLGSPGQVLCWGRNAHGQLGIGDYEDVIIEALGIDDATHVSAGQNHTCAVRAGGEVLCWGSGSRGQLGSAVGNVEASLVPAVVPGVLAVEVAAGGLFSCARLQDGRVSCWGGGVEGAVEPTIVRGFQRIVQLAAGSGHICGLDAAGEVWCSGREQIGEGIDEWLLREPKRVQGVHHAVELKSRSAATCARLATGRVVCFGGDDGVLGDGTAASPLPLPVQRLTDAIELGVGNDHGCARRASGTLVCWGAGHDHRLGSGGERDTLVPYPVYLEDLGCGAPYTDCDGVIVADTSGGGTPGCEVNTVDSSAHCGGCNIACGEDEVCRNSACTTRAITRLTAGPEQTCALFDSQEAKCWGVVNEESIARPPRGARQDFVELSAYQGLVCGLNETGGIKCDDPAEGREQRITSSFDAAAISLAHHRICVAHRVGTVRCWQRCIAEECENGEGEPTRVEGLRGAQQVVQGKNHRCALDGSGQVFCWGQNQLGELGTEGPATSSAIAVPELNGAQRLAAGFSHSCAVQGGQVYCWGRNHRGQLGASASSTAPVLVSGLSQVVDIALGDHHSCALLMTGEVYCWGAGDAGQLGSGDGDDRPMPSLVEGLSARLLTAGAQHTCASGPAGTFCFGDNTFGQLGDGGNAASLLPVEVQALR